MRSTTRDAAIALLSVSAVVLPFANGLLIGAPAPDSSLDRRYVQVVASCTLLLFGVVAFRAATLPPLARRLRAIMLMLVSVVVLGSLIRPTDAAIVSCLTATLLFVLPYTVLGAARRFAFTEGPKKQQRILATLLLLLATLFPFSIFAWGLVASQLGVAPVRLAHQSPPRNAGDEEVEFRARDGVLLRGTYSSGRRGAPAVIVVHGHSDGQTRMAGWSALIAERGFHALRFDFRGHGRSEGSVITFCDRERYDLEAAVDWLATREEVDHDRLFLLGTSMGGGVALASVGSLAPRGLRGVIAFAPPLDYRTLVDRTVSRLGPLAPLAYTMIDAVSHGLGQRSPRELAPGALFAEGPSIPLLLFHGGTDSMIPLPAARAFAEEHSNVELHVLAGVSHADIPAAALDDEESRSRVLSFLRQPRIRTTE